MFLFYFDYEEQHKNRCLVCSRNIGFLSLPVGVGALDDPRMLRLPPYIRLLSKQQIYIKPVGTGVLDCPSSLRLQNAHPSVILPDCRGRRPRRPEVIWVTAAHPSVAQKRDLR